MTLTGLKMQGLGEVRPLEDLEPYVPEEGDVRFTWGPQFNYSDGTANDFYEMWDPQGLLEVFKVVDVRSSPFAGLLYADSTWLVARFNNVAAAVHCKLWLD